MLKPIGISMPWIMFEMQKLRVMRLKRGSRKRRSLIENLLSTRLAEREQRFTNYWPSNKESK